MSIADLLTPRQAARLLGVDTSTLRRYARQCGEHLSEHANKKRRNYTTTDISTLREAQALLRTHSPEEVVSLLAVVDPNAEPPAIVESQLPALAGELERARELLNGMASRVDDIASRVDAIEAGFDHDIRSDRDKDRAIIDEQKSELAELRAGHERLRKWIETPFWLRMFRPPPE